MSYTPAYKQNINSSTALSVPIAPPPGSIIGFLGTTEPDGWVIANGQTRSNSDGRYNNLIDLAIGSASAGNYTPPDYRAAFLRGAGANGTYGGYSGDSVKGVQGQMIQNHNHTLDLYWVYADQVPNVSRQFLTSDTNNAYGGILTQRQSSNVNGAVTGSETRPFNFSVNWIIKL